MHAGLSGRVDRADHVVEQHHTERIFRALQIAVALGALVLIPISVLRSNGVRGIREVVRTPVVPAEHELVVFADKFIELLFVDLRVRIPPREQCLVFLFLPAIPERQRVGRVAIGKCGIPPSLVLLPIPPGTVIFHDLVCKRPEFRLEIVSFAVPHDVHPYGQELHAEEPETPFDRSSIGLSGSGNEQ